MSDPSPSSNVFPHDPLLGETSQGQTGSAQGQAERRNRITSEEWLRRVGMRVRAYCPDLEELMLECVALLKDPKCVALFKDPTVFSERPFIEDPLVGMYARWREDNGREDGKVEGLRWSIEKFVLVCYPNLRKLGRDCLDKTLRVPRLEKMLLALLVAEDECSAQKYLQGVLEESKW